MSDAVIQTVLITGAAGFIGSRTAELLLQTGIHVVGVDNLNDYYDPLIKEYRLKQLSTYENFTFEKLDIEDLDAVSALFDRYAFDAVGNLAARAGVRWSLVDPFVYVRTNMLGSTHLLENCHRRNVTKYVLASTSSLYAGQPMPFVETLPVNEPISPYAASKKGAEAMAFTYHYLYGVDVTVLRYFTVYGPAGRPDMSVYRFIRWIEDGVPLTIYGDGSQERDFSYVDDIARGTMSALTSRTGFEIINLGGNRPVRLDAMIRMVEENLDMQATFRYEPFHQADMNATWADTTRARERLGWQAEIPIEEGIRRTVAWHRENREFLQQIPLP